MLFYRFESAKLKQLTQNIFFFLEKKLQYVQWDCRIQPINLWKRSPNPSVFHSFLSKKMEIHYFLPQKLLISGFHQSQFVIIGLD